MPAKELSGICLPSTQCFLCWCIDRTVLSGFKMFRNVKINMEMLLRCPGLCALMGYLCYLHVYLIIGIEAG